VESSPIKIEYHYTVAFARRTTWAFLLRYGRRAFILAGAVFVIGVVRIFMHLSDLFTIGLLVLPIVIPITWGVYLRRATKLARLLGDRRIVIVIDEQGITFETTERRSFTSWASLKEVWKLRNVWLFFPYGVGVGGVYTAIPVEVMTADARSAVSRKLKEHGATVRG